MHIHPKKQGGKRTIAVPSDKSISHRAAMLASLADGDSIIRHFLMGEDCLHTMGCMKDLGIDITLKEKVLQVKGKGLYGLEKPQNTLNAGNSGTTTRLLSGILAAQNFESRIDGDDSLRARPMNRIITPLTQMGASIRTKDNDGFLPMQLDGKRLHGIQYVMPVASAQVKSAIMLAGLYAEGKTTILQPMQSRNHTELMLRHMGATIEEKDLCITVQPVQKLQPLDMTVPGDISSAAFFLVLGSILPKSEFLLPHVGVNPTRTGIIDALREMGADISLENLQSEAGESVADIRVKSALLHGIEMGGSGIPRLIDELPVLAIAACLAKGKTLVRDAKELRVKESDRIAVMTEVLRAIGGDITPTEDGWIIEGKQTLEGGRIHAHGDHRVAMALAVAGCVSQKGVFIEDADCAAVSFPGFYELLQRSF